MSDAAFVELCRPPTRREAEELRLVLTSQAIDARVLPLVLVDPDASRGWAVHVPTERLAEAQRILDEERTEQRLRALRDRPPPEVPRPGFYWVVGLMLVNLGVFSLMERAGGSEAHRVLLRFGASQAQLLRAGQWWRTVTAVFLHIGATHLVGNTVSLGVLGALALRAFGVGYGFAAYVLCGVAGNWVSFVVSPGPAIKAGASGAVLGLLGLVAGLRLRQLLGGDDHSRFRPWHVLATLVAFYGLVVGTGSVDHAAHVGGILAGLALSYLLPTLEARSAAGPRRWPALLAGLLALALVGGAAALAYRAGK